MGAAELTDVATLPALLRDLHRALLHYVALRNVVHERGGALLRRVIEDPAFEWLRELSQAMVLLDEVLEDGGPGSPAVDDVLDRLRDMVVRETSSNFRDEYLAALQQSPEVVLAHAAVAKVLSRPTASRP